VRSSRLSTRRRSRIGGTTTPTPTFARTGNAYLDGVSYAADTARFPNTAGTVGVLVEEGTTNLVASPYDLNGSGWSSAGTISVTANYASGPDPAGPQASRVSYVTGVYADRRAAVTLTAGTVNTVSLRIKNTTPGNGSHVRIILSDSTGATVATLADIAVTDSYTTYTLTGTPANSGSGLVRIASNAGLAAFDVLVWGVQSENKAYATTTTTGTRNAETLTIPTAGILKPDRGTVVVRAYLSGDIAQATPSAFHYLFDGSGAGSTNNLVLYRVSSGTWRVLTSNASGTTSTAVGSFTPTVGWHSLAGRWSVAETSVWYDGEKKGAATSPNLPSTLNANGYIGSFISGTNQADVPFAYAVFYDRALTDAEMVQATTGNLPPGYTALVDFRRGKLEAAKRRGVKLSDQMAVFYRRP
jgi:hypothetical protein